MLPLLNLPNYSTMQGSVLPTKVVQYTGVDARDVAVNDGDTSVRPRQKICAWCKLPIHTCAVLVFLPIIWAELENSSCYEYGYRSDNWRGIPSNEWDAISRLVSSQLMHVDVRHLLSNCVAIAAGGLVFEIYNGLWRTALLFWTSGIFGSCVEILSRKDTIPLTLCGASGAAFGTLGGLLGAVLLNLDEKYIRFPCKNGMVFGVFVWALALVQLIVVTTNNDPSVAHAAHVGSFAFGVMAGTALAINRTVRTFFNCANEKAIQLTSRCFTFLAFTVTFLWLLLERTGPRL